MKKTIFRNMLSLILVFTMLLSMIPIYAFAASKEKYIETVYASITEPKVSGSTVSLFPTSSDPSKYTVKVEKCTKVGSSKPMGPDDTFDYNEDYRIRLLFRAKEGYKFDGQTTANINGQKLKTVSWNYEETSFEFIKRAGITNIMTFIGCDIYPHPFMTVEKIKSSLEDYYDDSSRIKASCLYVREKGSSKDLDDKYKLQAGKIYTVKGKWNTLYGFMFGSYSEMDYSETIKSEEYSPAWSRKEISITFDIYVPQANKIDRTYITLKAPKCLEYGLFDYRDVELKECDSYTKDYLWSYDTYNVSSSNIFDYTDDKYMNIEKPFFKEGHKYGLFAVIRTKPGYSFEKDADIYLNGTKAKIRKFSEEEIMILADLTYEKIAKTRYISGDITEPVADKTPADYQSITFDSLYTFHYKDFIDITNSNTKLAKNDKIIAGHKYRINFSIDGHYEDNCFADDLTVVLNGRKATRIGGDELNPTFYIEFHAGPEGKINFDVDVDPVVENSIVKDHMPSVSKDECYIIKSFYYEEYNQETRTGRDMGSDDTFKGGYIYKLHLYIAPKPGHNLFPDNKIPHFTCNVNGENAEVTTYSDVGVRFLYIFKCRKADIEDIDIKIYNFVNGKKGNDIIIEMTDDDIGCSIKDFKVLDTSYNDMTYQKFKGGYQYIFDIVFETTSDEYHFDYDKVLLYTNYGTYSLKQNSPHELKARKYFTCEAIKIDTIEAIVDEPRNGDSPADLFATVPEGMPYRVESRDWYLIDGSSGYGKKLGYTEGCTEGKDYRCVMHMVIRNEYKGLYEFSGSTKAKINGENAEIESGNADEFYISTVFTCDIGPIFIDVVEATVDTPCAGDTPEDLKCTAPQYVAYSVLKCTWSLMDGSGPFGKTLKPEDKFIEGEKYHCDIEFIMNDENYDTHKITDDTTGKINGKTAHIGNSYPYGMSLDTYFVCEAQKTKLGDINGDGKITTADYAMLKRAVLETYKLSDIQKTVGDINHDGKIITSDYAMLKRAVLGTYTLK